MVIESPIGIAVSSGDGTPTENAGPSVAVMVVVANVTPPDGLDDPVEVLLIPETKRFVPLRKIVNSYNWVLGVTPEPGFPSVSVNTFGTDPR